MAHNAAATATVETKVADEVWIATALLTREHPDAADFTVEAITERARQIGFTRAGVYVHAVQHCVANRPPNPGRYRMLLETRAGRRRLYRCGDPHHAGRAGSKVIPRREEIPGAYGELLDWYQGWDHEQSERRAEADPLLALWGSGAKLWAEEPADAYVRRVREGWE